MHSLRLYYALTKPGIVYGNLLVAAAAFVYGSHTLISGAFNWAHFLYCLLGLGCIIASACVFNNYADRGLDAKMERTKLRPLVSGQILPRQALVFGAVLLILGICVLYGTNIWALGSALAGFIIYVFLYTPLKPKTPYALYIGALAGATPPLVGYAAASGVLNTQAWWLFLFLFIWQVPHFLAIAVYRNDEYAAAGVPLFMKGPYTAAQKQWGKRIFLLSLIVLLLWCAALAF